MKYILDFDHTLFDTRAFVNRLQEEGLGDVQRGRELISGIEEKNIDLTEFVYQDVLSSLSGNREQFIILSSYVSSKGDKNMHEDDLIFFQEAKIRLSGLADYVQEVVIVGKDKKSKLQEFYDQYNKGGISFIDDQPEHVSHAREIGFIATQINRDIQSAHRLEMPSSTSELLQVSSLKEFINRTESYEHTKNDR